MRSDIHGREMKLGLVVGRWDIVVRVQLSKHASGADVSDETG